MERDRAAITTSLRGLVAEEVTITAANRDLHSGMYGGAARNPIHVLSAILAALHDATGRVTLPGFYDGVGELPADLRRQREGLGFDAAAFLGDVGLSIPAGERDRSVLEQIWARPTAEVNGIVGGYTKPGFKTVIPSKASAKVSFRLVGDQDPEKIAASFQEFVRARFPPTARPSSFPTPAIPGSACPSTGRGFRARGVRSPTSGGRTRHSSAPAVRFPSRATSARCSASAR